VGSLKRGEPRVRLRAANSGSFALLRMTISYLVQNDNFSFGREDGQGAKRVIHSLNQRGHLLG
jgi:hypothetical protein